MMKKPNSTIETEAPESQKPDEVSKELQQGLKEELQDFVPELEQKVYKGRDVRKADQHVKKKKSPVKIIAIILAVVLGLMVAAVAAGVILIKMGRESMLSTGETELEVSAPEDLNVDLSDASEGIVVYNGQKYCYNNNIVSILCMGIDKNDFYEGEKYASGKSGQADSIFLLIIDTETGQASLLTTSRDTLVDLNVYNTKGEFQKTMNAQICAAYGFGDGKAQSCENVARSMNRLLFGIPINSYAAIDLDAIPVLNDAVGGVEVTVLDDMSILDPEMEAGSTVTLMGQQATAYVRSRNAEGPTATFDSNNARMERQKQYLSSFIKKALNQTKDDMTTPATLFNAASPYMVTNITVSKVTYLASLMLKSNIMDGTIYSVPGESVQGEKYAEFHVDEDALYEMVLELFYTKQS